MRGENCINVVFTTKKCTEEFEFIYFLADHAKEGGIFPTRFNIFNFDYSWFNDSYRFITVLSIVSTRAAGTLSSISFLSTCCVIFKVSILSNWRTCSSLSLSFKRGGKISSLRKMEKLNRGGWGEYLCDSLIVKYRRNPVFQFELVEIFIAILKKICCDYFHLKVRTCDHFQSRRESNFPSIFYHFQSARVCSF